MSVGRIDVIIPVYRDVAMTQRCILSVLEQSGDRLNRILIVNDHSPEPDMQVMLADLRTRYSPIRVIENEANLGFVRACNRGLALREVDSVVLNSDTRVTSGWLDELAAALESTPRAAAVSPLSNNATLCSIPRWGEGTRIESIEGLPLGTQHMERFTEMPTAVGFCMLLRKHVLDIIGAFDPLYGRGYNEENDWCQRARAAGFIILRANRALVFHEGEASFQGARASLDRQNARRLVARYPNYLAENAAFASSLSAHAAAIAHRTANGAVQVRIAEGHHSHPQWPTLLEHLRSELRSQTGIALDEPGSQPDVIVVPGFPRIGALFEILKTPAHILHLPFEIADLEGRPLGPPWRTVEELRAVSYCLWNSGAIILQSEKQLAALTTLHGGPAARSWLRPWPMPSTSSATPNANSNTIYLCSSRVTPTEIAHLLEAWTKLKPANLQLALAVPPQRIPRHWASRFEALSVRVEPPYAPDELLKKNPYGVLVAPSDVLDAPFTQFATAANVRIQAIETSAARAIQALLARSTFEPLVGAWPTWQQIFSEATTLSSEHFFRRNRLRELLGALPLKH